jgi:ubiquinone/menaquinone biosynthesis C-methylase UbiE
MPRYEYFLDSPGECERLERQAKLEGIDRHLRLFEGIPRETILDAGCGSGLMSRLLASRFPETEVVGLDLNPDYLAYARGCATAERLPNLSFEQGDVQSLPFADGVFDVVWSQWVLYFLLRPDLALREFRRVLRPGGVVLIALDDRPLLTNYPEDVALQQRLERVAFALADVGLARKMPLVLREAGFAYISVEIETCESMTILGAIDSEHRRNVEDHLEPIMLPIATILGGMKEAEKLRSDLLSYLDRSDTYTYTMFWIIQGTAV